MSSCVIPGSFDPMTRGHLNLVTRAASLYDHVTVTVMVNRSKAGCIPFEERVRMIRKACKELTNVQAETWDGLLADYMRLHPGSIVVRGARSVQEFEQEIKAAAVNRRLYPGLETVLIPAADELADVSSSVVREIASFGGDYSSFVPKCICRELEKWLKPKE